MLRKPLHLNVYVRKLRGSSIEAKTRSLFLTSNLS